MTVKPGELLAEEPWKGYWALKLPGIVIATLLLLVDGWFLLQAILGAIDAAVALAVVLVTLLPWAGLLAVGPLLRRQRIRIYDAAFAPPYKPLAQFLRGKDYLVPLDAIAHTEYSDGQTHLRVTTAEGRTFVFWQGYVGAEFHESLCAHLRRGPVS